MPRIFLLFLKKIVSLFERKVTTKIIEMHWFRRNQGTFRPEKKISPEHRGYRLQQITRLTLGSGNVRQAVKLPPGENINEWFSVSIVDFYNQISMIYETLDEKCTSETCPEMKAGNYTYYWQDLQKSTKPVMLSAPDYIINVMQMTDEIINDEKIFPSDPSVPFPSDFNKICQNIMKRLFRIYAHIYYHHIEDIKMIGTESNLNASFRHFIFFAQEFKLIPKEQLLPLKDIIDQINSQP